jgi:hypothetical protein
MYAEFLPQIGEKFWIFFKKIYPKNKKPCQENNLDRDKTKNKHYEQTLFYIKSVENSAFFCRFSANIIAI